MTSTSLPISLSRIAALALGIASFETAAQAQQILLQDSFTTPSAVLNGRTPDVQDTGGASWVDTSVSDNNYQLVGSNSVSGGVDNFDSIQGSNFASLAYAGTNFVAGDTYALSANFTFNNPLGPEVSPGNWIGLGFTNGNPGSAFNNGSAWMINLGDGGGVTWFADGFNQSGSNATAGLSTATLELQLAVLANGSANLTYLIGDSPDNMTALNAGNPLTLTADQVKAITGIGFYGYGYNGGTIDGPIGTLDNFELVQTPEPGTWAMLLGSLGLLAFVGRLRTKLGK